MGQNQVLATVFSARTSTLPLGVVESNIRHWSRAQFLRLSDVTGIHIDGKLPVNQFLKSFAQRLIAGALLIAPVYLAMLLLLKAMKSLERVVQPLARLLPQSFPAEPMVSLLIVLILCLLVGILLGTRFGQAARTRIEKSLLQKIPGYEMFRGMTRQLAGEEQESAWKPALAEIEDALVPAFIVEELADGRFTVFVPSVPTPLAGTIYILTAERVHPLDVPFTQAVKVVARWGSGSGALVDSMQTVTHHQ